MNKKPHDFVIYGYSSVVCKFFKLHLITYHIAAKGEIVSKGMSTQPTCILAIARKNISPIKNVQFGRGRVCPVRSQYNDSNASSLGIPSE